MINIKLNNINSNSIQVLLIQSLPPISKPLMRTNIEEIDGRDGDIVTKLGYSAYDKDVSIGLYGNYDIDQVIKYFNSEGNVIFSNEPDKYYKYQIINQIDFEKLIRFKTADVTFHVQPFKYSVNDNSYALDIVDNVNNFIIENKGNVKSKPTITIYGSGTINLSLNGMQIFVIDLGDSEYITIDSSEMNAYKGNTLMNRKIIGDYSNLSLIEGNNTISWTGTVTKVAIENYSRWI
jgi:predicted phage tail component-like protein